jgi:hypothetical protein
MESLWSLNLRPFIYIVNRDFCICANNVNNKWWLLMDDCLVVERMVTGYEVPSACPSKTRDAWDTSPAKYGFSYR